MPWIAPSNRPKSPRAPRYFSAAVTLTNITSDIRFAVEDDLTVLRDTPAPVDLSLSVRADPSLRVSFSTSVGADFFARDEIGLTARYDATAALDAGHGLRADSQVWLEFAGTVTPGYMQVEWLGPWHADTLVGPIEIRPSITTDIRLPLETRSSATSMLGNAFLPIDIIAGLAADTYSTAEVLAKPQVNNSIFLSGDALLTRDIVHPDEALGGARADLIPRVEALATIRFDGSTSAEVMGRLLRDVLPQIENLSTGTAAIVANAFPPIEILTTPLGDTISRAEILSFLISERLINAEWLSRPQGDTTLPAEATASMPETIDMRAPLEWSTAIRAAAETPLSVSAIIARDLSVFCELVSAVATDRASAIEAITAVARDASLPADTVGHTIAVADAILWLESGLTARADTVAQLEALNSVGRADAMLVIEALFAIAGDTRMPAEETAKGIVIHTTTPIEALQALPRGFALTNVEWERLIAILDLLSFDPIEHGQESAQPLLSLGRVLRSNNRRRVLPT